MKLTNFVKKLKAIERKYGKSMQVRMADNILVVEPVLRQDGRGRKCVIITDQK